MSVVSDVGQRKRRSSNAASERGLKDRIRSFFGTSGDGVENRGCTRHAHPSHHLGKDKLALLGPETELSIRLKQMSALQALLASKRLEAGSLDALWSQIRDLCLRLPRSSQNSLAPDARRSFLEFLGVMAENQLGTGPATEVLRTSMFHFLRDSSPMEFGESDVQAFVLILALTESGKVGMSLGMGPMVVRWSEAVVRTVPVCDVSMIQWLEFLSELVKSSGSGLEPEEAEQLVHLLCVHASSVVQRRGESLEKEEVLNEIKACLKVLDRILCWAVFPRALVQVLVRTLSKLVNAAELSTLSWRVMRNVLCSYLGYTCVIQLCSLLEEASSSSSSSSLSSDPVLLRGAIFFLAMGLWGAQRVDQLFYSPVAVLNAFRSALRAESLIVTFEILNSIKRLVDKYGKELQYFTWNGILEILEDIRKSLAASELEDVTTTTRCDSAKVLEHFHLVLDSMEALEDGNLYLGNQSQLYSLIESCSAQRPEASILTLLSFRSSAINPQCATWISDYHLLLSTYYFMDRRPAVRIKVLNILRKIYEQNRHLHDVPLLQEVIFPITSALPEETDADVSHTGLNLLADIAATTRARVRLPSDDSVHTFRDAFLEIADIFHNFLSNSLHHARRKHNSGEEEVSADQTLRLMDSVEKAVELLIKVLRKKWQVTPAYHSLYILRLLAKVLSLEYSVGMSDELGSGVRELIVALLSRLKANPASTRIGLVFQPELVVEGKSSGIEESPYLVCHDAALGQLHYQEESLEREVAMDWSWIATLLLTIIKEERVWRILQLLFNQLPEFLKNRALILSHPDSVPLLTEALTEAAESKDRVATLIQPPESLSEANLADHICPSLAILVAYRENLSRELQERLVSGIQTALLSGLSFRAVLGWVMCIVELPQVVLGMSRELVKHLDGLRKTPTMIIPVFELSSTLLRLPNLYAQFRQEDFLHVFNALLPATDTFSFTTFIVAVGHHLIYRWFLKVPIELRPRIAHHIRLRLEEIRLAALSKGQGGDPQLGMDENLLMDEFLRHYTYTNAPADADPPAPSQLMNLIKSQGWTRHWVEKNRVVSISAVSQTSTATSSCPKCVAPSLKEETDEFGSQRKRHQSAVQTRVTRPPQPPQSVSQDDTNIPLPQPSKPPTPMSICSCWSKGYALVEIRHCFGKSFWLLEINGAQVSRLQDLSVLVKLNRMVVEREGKSKETRARAATDKGGCPLNEPLSIRIEEAEAEDSEKSGDSSISGSYTSAKSTPALQSQEVTDKGDAIGDWEGGKVKSATANSGTGEVPVGLNPGWIFGQLFPGAVESSVEVGGDPKQREQVERSLRNLDLLPPYEAHKIGVIYAGPRQTTEAAMLANQSGTERYMRFLDGLGKLLPLKEKPAHIWTAGLDPDGRDGLFTYHWTDPITQVLFHVSTLIPTLSNDPACRNKKRHIGNDFVVIVYNDSGREYSLDTLTGKFSFVAIVVTPLHAETLSIKLLARPEISRWLSLKEAVVSDKEAPLLCRQIGMRAEFSAHCWQSGQMPHNPSSSIRSTYISGAMERLLHINTLRSRHAPSVSSPILSFK